MSERAPHQQPALQVREAARGSLTTYVTGFSLSLVLTLIAYMAVSRQLLSKDILVGTIIILAVAQLVVQMVFFLHLGSESKPRWNITAFLFMLMVLSILVFGSLWIMHNLNYHMHGAPGMQTDQYIMQDEGVHL